MTETTNEVEQTAEEAPENLIGDLGLDKVPSGVPNGTWKGFITNATYLNSVNRKEKSPGKAFVFNLKIDHPEPFEMWVDGELTPVDVDGMSVPHFLPSNKDDKLITKQNLRDTFEELGLSLKTVTKADLAKLEGTAVWFKTRKNGRFVNVTEFKKADGSGSPMTSSSQPANSGSSSQDPTDF